MFGNFFSQDIEGSRPLWLTPIILATQEAEIRRIAIEASPR
jgi:hypothetical protein